MAKVVREENLLKNSINTGEESYEDIIDRRAKHRISIQIIYQS